MSLESVLGDAAMVGLGLQAGLMAVDELHFHRKRGLGRFEMLSHPIDSLFFALALLVPTLFAPSDAMMLTFVALALISTALITKDEWIHAGSCEGGEHWIHACLFILHPVILAAVGLDWRARGAALGLWAPWAILAFMIYQLGYWGLHHHAAGRQQRVL